MADHDIERHAGTTTDYSNTSSATEAHKAQQDPTMGHHLTANKNDISNTTSGTHLVNRAVTPFVSSLLTCCPVEARTDPCRSCRSSSGGHPGPSPYFDSLSLSLFGQPIDPYTP